jgi:lysophospholipase L1-like esterase
MALIGILLSAFLFWSCEKVKEEDAPVVDMQTAQSISFNYLALGDSYTIGTGLVNENERYPIQLVDSLNKSSMFDGSPPRIIARNGWTTGDLLFGTDTAQIDTTYQLVSLLIGVNNQFQNRPLEEYTDEFEILLNRAIQYANNDTSRVFVLSIPDYGVTPFGEANAEQIAEEIDLFNSVNQSITESYGISYFNITPISRMAADDPGLIAPDNLHPSGEMYALWVEEMVSEIRQKLLP